MARKKQYNYFNTMELLAVNSHKAAEILEDIVDNYTVGSFEAKAEEIHRLEKRQ